MSELPVSDRTRLVAADLWLLAGGSAYTAGAIERGERDASAFVQAVAAFEAEVRAG